MTSRETRRERREQERKTAKLAYKAAKAAGEPIGFVSQEVGEHAIADPQHDVPVVTAPAPRRAEVNRVNAQLSTGPRTPEGKLASSRNATKHGLASGQIIIAGEDRTAFEALLTDLLNEHQPANSTEELLVCQMAQSYWLEQRAIAFQNECFTENGVDEKRLALFLRYGTTHNRAFYKALATLTRLQKERHKHAPGFVSQKHSAAANGIGFVSQIDGIDPPREEQSAAQAA